MAELDAETLQWARDQVARYAARRTDYVAFTDTLQQVLHCAAAEYAPLAIVQVRTKSIPSFAEKILRKRAAHKDPVNQFTDLCGGRVITHTEDQVQRVSRFLEEHFEIDHDNSENTAARLRTSEFGYQSVHYIITFKRGVFPKRGFAVNVPESLYGMENPRAEVQVRTILQHAWADIGHDMLYKCGFDPPEAWKREFARLAAMLETSDAAFGRVHEGMKRYVSSYGAYMTTDMMDAELTLLGFVREHAPDDVGLALRMAGIATAAGRRGEAVEVLEPFAETGNDAVNRQLGVALCGGHPRQARSQAYKRGQDLLGEAAGGQDGGGLALLALAGTWRGVDEKRARVSFRRAYEADPGEPHALAGHLEYEVLEARDTAVVTAAGAAIAAALETCGARTVAGLDIPRAYFTEGFLHLLRGEAFEALDGYAKGVQLSTSAWQIDDAAASIGHLEAIAERLKGYEWVRRLLVLGLAARFPSKASLNAVHSLMTENVPRLSDPILLVAGGCDPARAEQLEVYREIVVRGLAEFCGTVISGGTLQGVSGFVGEAAAANPAIHALSYLPRHIPSDATVDHRYKELRALPDVGFTPLGPLQAWADMIGSGVAPRTVRLLGISGGQVSAAEYRIALALGATVALVDQSGREAAKLLPDLRWTASSNLIRLPADYASVRAFAGGACAPLMEELREAIAQDLHAAYLTAKMAELRPDEPALAEWSALPQRLRESALQQADDVFAKLAVAGLEAVPVDGRSPALYLIPEAEVERLAEIEHGRWVVERLLAGWKYGPVKDVKGKISPYLVPWGDLTYQVQDWDRAFIRALPESLAKHGFEVRPRAGS